MAKVRTAARVDGNHAAIVRQLRAIGCSVFDVHQLPNAFDILVGFGGNDFIFEIKDPAQPASGRKLTPGETAFRDTWRGGQYHVIETFAQALQIINARPKTPKSFPPYGPAPTLPENDKMPTVRQALPAGQPLPVRTPGPGYRAGAAAG